MTLGKIAGGYSYRGVKIFKYRNGFSYWYTNTSKEYPLVSKAYPDTLKNTQRDLDSTLERAGVVVENGRVIITA